MTDCPHCGEPVDDDADSCPHCGSDYETGWKPDADYYGLELPEDEPVFPQSSVPGPPIFGWDDLWGLGLVAAAVIVFLAVGVSAYRDSPAPLAVFALLLGSSLFVFFRWLSPKRRRRS